MSLLLVIQDNQTKNQTKALLLQMKMKRKPQSYVGQGTVKQLEKDFRFTIEEGQGMRKTKRLIS